MPIASKWDQTCNLCYSTWKKGDMIDLRESGKWCTNKDCGNNAAKPAESAPVTEVTKTEPSKARAALVAFSTTSMDVARLQTDAIFDGDSSTTRAERLAMVHLIYGKCMDALIGGTPSGLSKNEQGGIQ